MFIIYYIYDNKQPLSLTIVPGHIKSHVAKKDKTGSVDYCRSVAESSWSSTFPAISLHLQTFGSCLSTARIKEVASAAGTSVLTAWNHQCTSDDDAKLRPVPNS